MKNVGITNRGVLTSQANSSCWVTGTPASLWQQDTVSLNTCTEHKAAHCTS